MKLSGEYRRCFVASLLLTDTVALEFDVDILRAEGSDERT
jgi:hypothetical protein